MGGNLTSWDPTPVRDVWDGDDVVLSWLPVTEDVNGNPITISRYEVWRSLSPSCVPGRPPASRPRTRNEPADALFIDVDAALTTTPYYYQVRASAQQA